MTSDPNMSTPKVILQSTVGTFSLRVLLVRLRFMGRKCLLFAPSRIMIDQLHMSQTQAIDSQLVTRAGRIHQAVQFVTRFHVIIDSGTAVWLSCAEALVRSVLTGTPQSAVSKCSL